MELLPIIYTTLALFAGLTLVAIIISYTLFKVKKSGKGSKEQETTKEEKPVKPPQIKKISSPAPENRSKVKKVKKAPSGADSDSRQVRKSPSDKKRHQEKPRKKPIKPQKDRIEILNKTQNGDSFPTGLANRSGSNRENLSGTGKAARNQFDNYDEENQTDDFHPLG